MSAGRYRGLFWAPEGEPIPGTLEVSGSGDLHVELQGQLLEGQSALRETALIEGELAGSPFPGPMITLFQCLRTGRQLGPGGSLETWLAHRALSGREVVASEAVFDGVQVRLQGLAAFLGAPPPDFGPKREEWISVKQFVVDDWTVDFGWRVTGQKGAASLRMEASPLIEVVLKHPRTVDEILRGVVPVFEAILTIALQRHARVEHITVSAAQGRDALRVLAPRVEAPGPHSQAREPFTPELLFSLAEMPGGHVLLQRARQLCSQQSEFTAIFLGNERAPPGYVEDLVRVAVLTLAYLAGAFPEALERARQRLARFETAPADMRAFLPSAGLIAVPELVRALLTPGLCAVLGVASKEALAERVGLAFRWVILREGEEFPLLELVQLRHQLRALLYLCLLRLLGFDSEDAEQRLARVIQWRGLP